MDEKFITSMDNYKGVSRLKRAKLLEEWNKLTEKGLSQIQMKVVLVMWFLKNGKINKDDREAIIIEVLTYIGDSDYNYYIIKT